MRAANHARHHERISRFLSLILRHAPDTIGLALDGNGWADVAELLEKAARHGTPLTLDLLRDVVATNDKQRFAFSDDGLRIRASQGHSLRSVDLALQPQTPPDVLYHGTASRFVTSIRQAGLRPGARRHVHLSTDIDTAVKVGTRYGVPVVLTIQAAAMHALGHLFYRADNGVWLTDAVPARFIAFPISRA
ncbi:putative RNA 2'-phosphotransferase [Pseudoduganella flava]|uniref:Probable RNA 2'-phosphotransferase n=1 Tax=Pseudoduganella flava TaxID=871742 RepID=A0A562PW61_9BURK|nr:RNA 2'-phosphotransferase [Pseudoduganella flava]QGZ39775.1 RNA 2'-phosphotransferase [Pseudoduganella flava]TWI48691.1 putative RNA 2'-phosphotransferase [Pseudoduganella flava]